MTIRSFTLTAAVLFTMSIAPATNNVASAMPVNKSVATSNAAAATIQTVQYHRRGRGHYHRGRRDGAGVAAGVIGGMILGGMLAGPRAYDYAPGPSYGPGYDGYRHPCP